MAQIIGKINTLDGSFYIKGADGKLSSAKVGDTIYAGDIVVGSGSNSTSSSASVLLSDNSKTINILGSNQQLFDETMLTLELSSDTVVQEDVLSEALLLESVEDIVQEEDITDEQATLTIEDIENLDAAAAGDETPSDTEVLSARLEDRTAGETDVTTDLRDSTDSTDGALVDDAEPVVVEGAPVISLIAESTTILEGNSGVLTLLSSEPPFEDIVVEFTYSGVAQDGSDFTGVASVIIPTGVDTVNFDLNTLTDGVYEGSEDFNIAISNVTGSNASISETDSDVDLTIIDSDEIPVVSIEATTDTATEGEGGGVVFTVSQTTVSAFNTDVDFTLNLGELELEDISSISYGATTLTSAVDIANFISNGVTLTIPAGTSDTPTVTVVPVDDDIYEIEESFSGSIALSAGETDAVLGTSSDTAKFLDEGEVQEGDKPTVNIQATTDSATEGVAGGVVFTISQTNESNFDTSVDFTLGLGDIVAADIASISFGATTLTSAVDIANFISNGTTLTISANTTETPTVTIVPFDDNIIEGTENFTGNIALSAGETDALLGTSLADAKFLDNDSGLVSITATADAYEEGTVPGEFTVSLDKPSSTDTVVLYSVQVGSTATDGGVDYTTLSGTVTITAGTTSNTIDVAGIVDDNLIEGTETVVVQLDSISSGDPDITIDGSNDTATVNIFDNDFNEIPVIGDIAITLPNEISYSTTLNDVIDTTFTDDGDGTHTFEWNEAGSTLPEVYVDGSLVEWVYDDANQKVEGKVGATVYLTIQLNVEDGDATDITVTQGTELIGFPTSTSFSAFAAPAGNNTSVVIDFLDNNNEVFLDALITSTGGTINTNSNFIGVDNNLMNVGEVIDMDFSQGSINNNVSTVEIVLNQFEGSDELKITVIGADDVAQTPIIIDTSDLTGDNYTIESANNQAIKALQFESVSGQFKLGFESISAIESDNDFEVELAYTLTDANGDSDGGLATIVFDGDQMIDYDVSHELIDGGAGEDTLVLDSLDGNIDFSLLDNDKIKNIENIDLTDGAHSLEKLSLQDVIDLTDGTNKTLLIKGDNLDSVELQDGSGTWSTNGGTTQVVDSVTYDVYTNTEDSSYKVLIQQDITDTVVS